MPTIEQAFEQFGGAAELTVLDLNSAYYQIPLSFKSRRVTAFCTLLASLSLTSYLWGSVWVVVLSRVIDELFTDLKGRYVFNFLHDLVVYSPSAEERVVHVRELLGRLQTADFTLNPDSYLWRRGNKIPWSPAFVSRHQDTPRQGCRYSQLSASYQLEGIELVHRHGGLLCPLYS